MKSRAIVKLSYKKKYSKIDRMERCREWTVAFYDCVYCTIEVHIFNLTFFKKAGEMILGYWSPFCFNLIIILSASNSKSYLSKSLDSISILVNKNFSPIFYSRTFNYILDNFSLWEVNSILRTRVRVLFLIFKFLIKLLTLNLIYTKYFKLLFHQTFCIDFLGNRAKKF